MDAFLQNFRESRWPKWAQRPIVGAFFLLVGFASATAAGQGEDAADSPALRAELKAARQRNVALNAALAQAREEAASWRKRHAEVHTRYKQLTEKLAFLRLRAASLLVNGTDLKGAEVAADLVQRLAYVRTVHRELHVQLLQFRRSLEQSLKELLEGRAEREQRLLRIKLQAILRKLQDAELLAGGEGQRAEPETGLAATVVAVNNQLQVVALDVGIEHGVRPGMQYRVTQQHGNDVLLRILETRPTLSAAAVVDGDWQQLAPGARAAPIIEPESAAP